MSNSLGLILGSIFCITVLYHCVVLFITVASNGLPVILSQDDPSPQVEEQGYTGGDSTLPVGRRVDSNLSLAIHSKNM